MGRTIRLSRTASKNLERLLLYLEAEWSKKVRKDFVKKFDNKVQHLAHFPDSHPVSASQKGLHKLVVTKQTSVFYRFD